MKNTKILIVTLLAGFSLYQLALGQTNATDATPAAAAADASTNTASPAPAMAEASNAPVGMTVTNETAGTDTNNAPMASVSNAEPAIAAGATASNTPAAAVDTNQPATAMTGTEASGTNAAATARLPISFQDVPITTAIETLARLANINYLLDPKIGYNQPDQNGQVKPEPTLSIRWENVTAQQALVAVLDNYGLQLVENPKTGIYKVTTKNPAEKPPLITRVVQLKYASTSNMLVAVQSCLTDSRSKVVPDQRTSQLVVVATDPEQAAVDTLVYQLDKPTRQVLIETKLVELSSNPSTSKGIDWSGTLQAQNFSFGNGVLSQVGSTVLKTVPATTTTTTTDGGGSVTVTTPASTGTTATTTTTTQSGSTGPGGTLAGLSANTASGFSPSTFFLTADGVSAVLSFLNQSKEAQVVSTPRIVTLDNEPATITVTRAFPIINITAGTVQTAGGSQVTYSNLGTILEVTPRISANDYIWLKVQPSVSSFFGKDTETINGLLNTADIFDTRTIDTQVLIPNAHTLVLGGLVQDNPNATYTKVPILGDIPVLGLAFRSQSKSMSKDNLLIFITPTIVKDADFKPTTTDFLDSQPRYMQDPLNMSKWHDSAQPGDWSNPLPDNVDKNPMSVAQ